LTRSLREKIDIMGVGVHPLTLEESTGVIAGWIEQARQRPNDWKPRLFAAWTGAPSEDSWQDVAKVSKLSPEEPWPWAASGLIYLQWKGFVDQADAEFGKAWAGIERTLRESDGAALVPGWSVAGFPTRS